MERPSGVAFLLAQLGSHATARFAERMAEIGLTPAHAGLLRIVVQEPGLSQQEIARRLDALPSRVVALVDQLEARRLIRRERSDSDRRSYRVVPDPDGAHDADAIRRIVVAHDAALTRALTPSERATLASLLAKVAAAEGLTPGVHPGYRRP